MAEKKISELVSLTGANAATGDLLPIVDISATETKKITRDEFFKNIPSIDVTGNITVGGTVDSRDVAADGSKLDGIEAGADVTDTANVTAAGALMDSELTDIAAVKALDQGVATTDDPTFTNTELAAIAASKAVTAVDVFVYDTSKDSDGGAWRKRTQHTSWYNETLNTATRGSRREFPAVAVIVAESNKVTIYDGDDPALPMWRVFTVGTFPDFALITQGPPTSLWAVNGIVCVGGTDGGLDGRVFLLNMIADNMRYASDSVSGFSSGLANSNGAAAISQVNGGLYLGVIVNPAVNDVAMTVLPDAPIDPATGLPVPTIAVATDGGVSVIKDDGTVTDSAATLTMGQVFFDDFNGLFYQRNVTTGILWYSTKDDYTAGDGFGDEIARTTFGTNSFDLLAFSGASGNLEWASDSLAIGGDVTPLLGLMLHQPNYTDQSKGMSALLTSTYNTGWMNGDIKGAFLSDTDDTDLVGSGELVTNGDFPTDLTGWSDPNSGWSQSGGAAVMASTGDYKPLTQDLGLVAGKTYVITFDVVAISGTMKVALDSSSPGISNTSENTFSATGSYAFTVTPSAGETYLIIARSPFTFSSVTIDNISVKLADEDRSVNG